MAIARLITSCPPGSPKVLLPSTVIVIAVTVIRCMPYRGCGVWWLSSTEPTPGNAIDWLTAGCFGAAWPAMRTSVSVVPPVSAVPAGEVAERAVATKALPVTRPSRLLADVVALLTEAIVSPEPTDETLVRTLPILPTCGLLDPWVVSRCVTPRSVVHIAASALLPDWNAEPRWPAEPNAEPPKADWVCVAGAEAGRGAGRGCDGEGAAGHEGSGEGETNRGCGGHVVLRSGHDPRERGSRCYPRSERNGSVRTDRFV